MRCAGPREKSLSPSLERATKGITVKRTLNDENRLKDDDRRTVAMVR